MTFLTVFFVILLVLLLLFLALFFALIGAAARIFISPLGIVIALLGCAYWVYDDAKMLRRHGGISDGDTSPALWFVYCLVGLFVAFPLYLSKRKGYCTRAAANNVQFAEWHRNERQDRLRILSMLVFFAASVAVLFGIYLLILHWIGPIKISPFIYGSLFRD